jgi:hypothetical protein
MRVELDGKTWSRLFNHPLPPGKVWPQPRAFFVSEGHDPGEVAGPDEYVFVFPKEIRQFTTNGPRRWQPILLRADDGLGPLLGVPLGSACAVQGASVAEAVEVPFVIAMLPPPGGRVETDGAYLPPLLEQPPSDSLRQRLLLTAAPIESLLIVIGCHDVGPPS